MNSFSDDVSMELFQKSNNSSESIPSHLRIESVDTAWIMTSSFIIFTMQTGFGLLESGCVSMKNEVNIMMKNMVDIVLGGTSYWIFGYAFSFGRGVSNSFLSFGDFFVDAESGDPMMGPLFAAFLFQLSFSTTATTIVSGAMAERCNFFAYCWYSLLNTIIYCLPARWVWADTGFLNILGVVDIAGSGPVHLLGGASAFASALMLGPRLGRYINGRNQLPAGNPVNCCLGLFALWWGWLAFNSGSTYGISGAKLGYSAKAAVMTMISSIGGGVFALFYSIFIKYDDPMVVINSILGALVGVTAGCFLYEGWESFIIGVVGGSIATITAPLIDKFGIDDPVGATSVHGFCGVWGVLAVGLFAADPYPLDTTNGRSGLFHGGGWYLLGVQTLACVCIIVWSLSTSVLLLWLINIMVPIRLNEYEELLGGDLCHHYICHDGIGLDEAIDALLPRYPEIKRLKLVPKMGKNIGHSIYLKQTRSKTDLVTTDNCNAVEELLSDAAENNNPKLANLNILNKNSKKVENKSS